ncbi:RidA family protein [Thalassospira sp.]|uniref:RidA family protein n=1 Tax=Thalassospira sp. TaxID=1912094 RepID=UPI003AA81EA2
MSTELTAITTNKAPQPFGHYVQGTLFNGLIHVSGQLGALADGSHGFGNSFSVQARQCLLNIMAIIEEGGGSKHSVLKVTAYIVSVENWPEFNSIFQDIFGEARPARAVVPVPELHHGYLIEIDAVAFQHK